MNQAPDSPCRRPGCSFPRMFSRRRGGNYRKRPHCSQECRIWLRRAARASRNGDAVEAAEVMRLSVILDARTSPLDQVPEVFAGGLPD